MIQFETNPQREAYFAARGKIVLNACPGSGKTTCIVHKLPILEQECLGKYGHYSGIACLSFTNIAKHELLHKYKATHQKDLSYPHLVSTIDSFLNQYVTLPYINLIRKDIKRPKIVDDASLIDKMLRVTFQKRDGTTGTTIQKPLNQFETRSGTKIYLSYPPGKIWISADGTYTYQGKVPSASSVDPQVFQQYGKALFKWKVDNGIMTSLDSSFLALYILQNFPYIGKWLSVRFPYIVIDEAQDNSEIQHAIFDRLLELGLNHIELIGDPYQSLYEWRDARPQLFLDKYNGAGWQGLPLSQNRRSVQRIIDCFSIIRNTNDEVITSHQVTELNLPLRIYKYSLTNADAIIYDFEKECKAHGLVSNQIVVRGKKFENRMVGKTASVEPWKSELPYQMLSIMNAFRMNATKDAVNSFRKIAVELANPSLTYREQRDLIDELKSDYVFNGKLFSFLLAMPTPDLSIDQWSTAVTDLFMARLNIDVRPSFLFKMRLAGFKMVDLKKEMVARYFDKAASKDHNIPITTIHQVKGATLDAILYFFDKNSTGESVSFRDFSSATVFPSEKQRMIYVACSRPRQLLAMAFPADITDNQLKSKFGSGIQIISLP